MTETTQKIMSGLKIFAQDTWKRVAPYVGHNPDRNNSAADPRPSDGAGRGVTGVNDQTQSMSTNRDLSGRGMDRKIDRSKTKLMIGIGAGIAVLAFAAFVWAVRPAAPGVYVVDAAKIQIETAAQGQLDDFVTSLGSVVPGQTIFLDAVEGGRVEKIHALSGDVVKEDQILLELSNTQLQLEVITREAEVADQLNTLREKEIESERRRLDHISTIAQLNSRLAQMERDLARNERLFQEGAYAAQRIETDREQAKLQKELLVIETERQTMDVRMSKSQMEKMKNTTDRLERNLDTARAALDALTVRAPADGTLTSFNPELGQSLARGTRVGQVDSIDDLELTVAIDEFYLERFREGLPAEVKIGEETFVLKVGRVSAQVENGTFKADLHFVGDRPPQMRRGQSFPVKVILSDATQALVLPRGPFMTATGGRWAFVVNKDGTQAERRDIKIGRSNASAVEILDGISPGEKVVISDYEGFQQAKALQIRK
jgi:HlyD family secretion protein